MSSHAIPIEEATIRNRQGLWLFFLTEVFLFGSFFVLRFALWGDTRPELEQTAGLIATGVLLVSSLAMNRAEVAIAHGDKTQFRNNILVTFVLGAIFLGMILIYEWGAIFGLHGTFLGIPVGHILPSDGVYGSVLYLMTGAHALHVLGGLVFIIMTLVKGMRGDLTVQDHFFAEACALYWHFVDLVWVFFYPALYLVGHVVDLH